MPWVTRQNGTDMELSVLVLKGADMGQKMVSLVTILQEHLSREMQNARRFWTNVERQAKPVEFNTKIL